MQIYNPTKVTLYHDCHSKNYKMEAGQTRNVPDEVGELLIRRLKDYGLVALEYGDFEEVEYGSFSEFKKIKALEGLENYKEFLTNALHQEMHFSREVVEKNGGPKEAVTTKEKYFEKAIEDINNEILEAKRNSNKESKEIKQEVKQETIEENVPRETLPTKIVKRRGRPPRKSVEEPINA